MIFAQVNAMALGLEGKYQRTVKGETNPLQMFVYE